MAHLRIDKGDLSPSERFYQLERKEWDHLVQKRKDFAEYHMNRDCQELVAWVKDAEEYHVQLGYDTPEAMISQGYGMNAEEVELAVRWLEVNQVDYPIGFAEAVIRGRKLVKAKQESEERPEQGRPLENVSNTYEKLDDTERNSASGILRRLTRKAEKGDEDAREALDQYRAGEISVNQAAIKTGMRKKRSSVMVDRQAVVDWINRTFDDDDCLWISDELTRSPR